MIDKIKEWGKWLAWYEVPGFVVILLIIGTAILF